MLVLAVRVAAEVVEVVVEGVATIDRRRRDCRGCCCCCGCHLAVEGNYRAPEIFFVFSQNNSIPLGKTLFF